VPEVMRLFNTLSRSVEDFRPLKAGHVGIYTCGPTVYSYAHIGNMRAYIFADVLRRTFELFGYDVKHVMNITDVGHLTGDGDEGEDKLELGSRREGLDAWAVAKKYTEAFFAHTAMLNIERPTIVCKATDYIPEQIAMVQALADKGFAYTTEDGVYYDTSRFPTYTQLGRLDVEGLQEGHRVDMGGKRQKTDFALWKLSKPTEHRCMEWDAPWGRGFPGWHIECSAMATKLLGDQFDIHTGGVDHIPIHHTNEIAQSEGATGKSPFVRYWMHGEFLVIGDEAKMSKSAGKTLTVQSLADQGIPPLAFRLLVLQCHYRKQLKFTDENMAGAVRGYERLRHLAQKALQAAGGHQQAVVLSQGGDKYRRQIHAALTADLNAPQALASLFGLLEDQQLSPAEQVDLAAEVDQVLGLGLLSPAPSLVETPPPAALLALLDERNQARSAKQWQRADQLRDEIARHGYDIHDAPSGTSLKRRP